MFLFTTAANLSIVARHVMQYHCNSFRTLSFGASYLVSPTKTIPCTSKILQTCYLTGWRAEAGEVCVRPAECSEWYRTGAGIGRTTQLHWSPWQLYYGEMAAPGCLNSAARPLPSPVAPPSSPAICCCACKDILCQERRLSRLSICWGAARFVQGSGRRGGSGKGGRKGLFSRVEVDSCPVNYPRLTPEVSQSKAGPCVPSALLLAHSPGMHHAQTVDACMPSCEFIQEQLGVFHELNVLLYVNSFICLQGIMRAKRLHEYEGPG